MTTTQDAANSRLPDNVLSFCRTLRRAGIPLGPGMVLDAMRAVASTGLQRRDDFRSALRAVLVGRAAEMTLFDQAFHVYFRNPRLLEQLMTLLLPERQHVAGEPNSDRLLRRIAASIAPDIAANAERPRVEADRPASYSAMEVFREKDFEQMNEQELADARRLLRDSGNPARELRTRRFQASSRGFDYDLRRSMHTMLKNGGELPELARRRRKVRPQPLVLLCDISGSMSRYSRMFLHYAHALATAYRTVQIFVFGTRLTNITRWLRNSDVDVALERVSLQVDDWDGGTRIADSLKTFNRDWGRRVLAANACVVLLSDGLERDSAGGLEFQMQRLKRSCRQLVWMNPMLRYKEFEPRASGVRAMLPHVDRFIPAHSIASVSDLGRLLTLGDRHGSRRRASDHA